ncbi:MAG TPA: OmpA family protein, partial [Saprospiraceae bacterium]|nr:OmpA family protein [Saprospiraceae bacterium]
ENLGFPLNTSTDDFALVMDKTGRKGLFSSNRPGGIGYDDIYSFVVNSYFVVGKVVERYDSTRHVPEAKVILMNDKFHAIDSVVSDEHGNFHFDLAFDKDYHFSGSKQGYSWIDSLSFSTYTRALGRDSLILPLWKHNLFAKGSVYSNETQDKLPDAVVVLENITDGRIDSIVTNPTGAYNFLIMPNKKYRVRAQKEGFIPRSFELNTRGITHGDLLNDFLLEEVFMEKVVIQFEFDKWNIKPAYHQQLEEIARIAKRNRQSHIHIGAYADSFGSSDYNLSLSNKRANEVVKYFESHGIEVKRMTAIGFGEELLINECSDGVICSQEEHSKNRRAELKVQLWKEN